MWVIQKNLKPISSAMSNDCGKFTSRQRWSSTLSRKRNRLFRNFCAMLTKNIPKIINQIMDMFRAKTMTIV